MRQRNSLAPASILNPLKPTEGEDVGPEGELEQPEEMKGLRGIPFVHERHETTRD